MELTPDAFISLVEGTSCGSVNQSAVSSPRLHRNTSMALQHLVILIYFVIRSKLPE